MEVKKVHFYYLDIIKIIAIICVCSYHFSIAGDINFSENLNMSVLITRFVFGINSIGVPLFFMVNGALLFNRDIDIKRHVRTMIIMLAQYYAWRLITVLVLTYSKTGGFKLLEEYNLLKIVFLFNQMPEMDLSHLWFIPTLLCIYLIIPCYNRVFCKISENENKYLILFSLVALYILCFACKDITIIFRKYNIDLTPLSQLNPFQGLCGSMLFYFLLGGLLHRENVCEKTSKVLFLMFTLGAIILLYEWYLESLAFETTWDSVFNGYQTTATILMATSVFLLAKKIPNAIVERKPLFGNVLLFFGGNTLNVYYIHWLIGYVFFGHINRPLPYNLGANIIKAITLVILCSLIGAIMKKIPLLRRLTH